MSIRQAIMASLSCREWCYSCLIYYLKHTHTSSKRSLLIALSTIVHNKPLLKWFLSHGANPNCGPQRLDEERYGYGCTESGTALNYATCRCTPQCVDLLLDAGARMEFSIALHCAPAAVPHGAIGRDGPVRLTREEELRENPEDSASARARV